MVTGCISTRRGGGAGLFTQRLKVRDSAILASPVRDGGPVHGGNGRGVPAAPLSRLLFGRLCARFRPCVSLVLPNGFSHWVCRACL